MDRCSSLTLMFLSLSFSLPSPLSKNKINKILTKRRTQKERPSSVCGNSMVSCHERTLSITHGLTGVRTASSRSKRVPARTLGAPMANSKKVRIRTFRRTSILASDHHHHCCHHHHSFIPRNLGAIFEPLSLVQPIFHG